MLGAPQDRDLHPICTLRGQTPRVPTLNVARKYVEIKGESLEPASGLEPLTC